MVPTTPSATPWTLLWLRLKQDEARPGDVPRVVSADPAPGLDKWRPIVLVNLLWLVPGVVGGSEESITDALRAVADLMGSDLNTEGLDLHLAVLRPFLTAHPDLADRFPLEVLDSDGSDKVRRVLAEQTWLASAARRVGARVVHHAGGIVPLRHPGRVVLTLHDLQPLDLPDNFSTAKRSYIRAMARRSVRAADVVCVPSAFTRDRAVELLGAPAEKFVVVPWSVASRPPSTTPPSAPASPASTRLASTWPASTLPASTTHLVPEGRYFLFPAITHPHKNHSVLLDAFAALVRDDPDCDDVQLGSDRARGIRRRTR